MGLKLNLGSGANILPGFINVDRYGSPDVKHDLETAPWPFEENGIEMINASHVLEHLGATPDGFIAIMKEMYRVCADGAIIDILAPHHAHDDFYGDPTHVRALTPNLFGLFSKKHCERWVEAKAANTPLALMHNVDFDIVKYENRIDPAYAHWIGQDEALQRMMTMNRNIVREIFVQLRCVKEPVNAVG